MTSLRGADRVEQQLAVPERTSRSRCGVSRASASSPSGAPIRGKDSVVKPTRQTTRGTRRIGTMGTRSAAGGSWRGEWVRGGRLGRTVIVRAAGIRLRSRPGSTGSPNSRCSWLTCQASASRSGQRRDTGADRGQPLVQRLRAGERVGHAPQSTNLRQPTSSTRLLPTSSRSVFCSQAPNRRTSPRDASTRSSPNRHVLCTYRSVTEGGGALRQSHRMLDLARTRR